jgi:hypothetical protein
MSASPGYEGAQADTLGASRRFERTEAYSMKRAPQHRLIQGVLAAVATLALAGCHAQPAPGHPLKAFEITIRNQGADVHQLEVDYPHASFGQDFLASGANFNYLPKVIGSGPVKISFTDSMGKPHSATGPMLQENQQKELVITIGEDEGIQFQDMPEQHN